MTPLSIGGQLFVLCLGKLMSELSLKEAYSSAAQKYYELNCSILVKTCVVSYSWADELICSMIKTDRCIDGIPMKITIQKWNPKLFYVILIWILDESYNFT